MFKLILLVSSYGCGSFRLILCDEQFIGVQFNKSPDDLIPKRIASYKNYKLQIIWNITVSIQLVVVAKRREVEDEVDEFWCQ